MTYSAADRKDIRRAEKDEAVATRQRGEVIFGLMSTSPGRAYIWEQLSAAHIFSTSFALDALQMAFSEGERNAGLRLLNDIMDTCPDEFILMMRERNERDSARQRPGSQDGNGGAGGSDAEVDGPADPRDEAWRNAGGQLYDP